MTPRVSICIPAYRQVEFLRETLDSIKAQDFGAYEVVITDDSPDAVVETLVENYLGDRRWRYIRNTQPLGSPGNWNKAMRMSSAPLVKLLHHDDKFVGPEALGRFVAIMDANPAADFGFSSCFVVDAGSGRARINQPSAAQVKALSRSPATLFAANIVGAPSTTIHRRLAGLEYDPAMKWLVDIDFYYRMLKREPLVAYESVPLITTATSAAHQITEEVRTDPVVDIGEHLRLFEKFDAAEQSLPAVAAAWRRVFYRYGIRSESQLVSSFSYEESTAGYLAALLRGSPANRIRSGVGRLFYRTYMLLPAWAQAQVRAAKGLMARRGAERQ